jgi:hypothetical protein
MKHARDSYRQIQDPSGKIPEDEPVFLLRAQDPVAAEVVDYWVERTEAKGGDPGMLGLARDQADRMEAWPIKKAVADIPKGDLVAHKFRNVNVEEELRKVIADSEEEEVPEA